MPPKITSSRAQHGSDPVDVDDGEEDIQVSAAVGLAADGESQLSPSLGTSHLTTTQQIGGAS